AGTGGRAGRAGGARPGALRQLRRPARTDGAAVETRRAPPAWPPRRPVRDRGRRALDPGPARTGRRQARAGSGGAHRPRAAAPLWRGLLAAAGTRGRVAAVLARAAARLPPLRSARRGPRRALRRRPLGRAVRPARSGRQPAPGAAEPARRATARG